MIAVAPVAAIKLTFDCLASFEYMYFDMNFDNWHLVKKGWSLETGVG